MKNIKNIFLVLLIAIVAQGCSGIKVLSAWKAEQPTIDEFKKKNVLVIARTADNQARIAFEESIANQLRSRGVNATESFKKVPTIHPEREMTEERAAMIKSLLESEGYNGIVITVVKEKTQHTETTTSGMYVGASYGNYYPGYYGGFYNYYRTPYAYGPYYSSFGGYVPLSGSTDTRTYNNYVLETVAYDLDAPVENQIVAVVSTSLEDPKNAYKTAPKYVEEITKHLDLVKN